MLLLNVSVHRVTLNIDNFSDRDYTSSSEASLNRAKCLQNTKLYTDAAVLTRRPHGSLEWYKKGKGGGECRNT